MQSKNIQLTKSKMKSGDISTEVEEIERIIVSDFKNLYSTKLENLKEMDSFLDKYHIPKLN